MQHRSGALCMFRADMRQVRFFSSCTASRPESSARKKAHPPVKVSNWRRVKGALGFLLRLAQKALKQL